MSTPDSIHGPATLPLRWGPKETVFTLWHFDFGGDRWIAAVAGDIGDGQTVPLRIESACVFGHVFRSAQCDCGFQLEEAMRRISVSGRGLVIYGLDQDARGLGTAAHFAIYAMRQQEGLDSDVVYQRLAAPMDARSYAPVVAVLRHLEVSRLRLLSNNPRRAEFLRAEGFVVDVEPLEAPLDIFNMSTLMLEKEDLGYDWTFDTHASWLAPLQAAVADEPDRSLACVALAGAHRAAGAVAEANDDGTWEVSHRLAAAMPSPAPGGILVAYLTDLPRRDELPVYRRIGVQVICVPFPEIPTELAAAATTEGVRIVDWSRDNAYRAPRLQWVLVGSLPGCDVYERDGCTRVVYLDADASMRERLKASPAAIRYHDGHAFWLELSAHPTDPVVTATDASAGAVAGREGLQR